jgi:hypothetical protein
VTGRVLFNDRPPLLGCDSSSRTVGLEHREAAYSHHIFLEKEKSDPFPTIIIIIITNNLKIYFHSLCSSLEV